MNVINALDKSLIYLFEFSKHKLRIIYFTAAKLLCCSSNFNSSKKTDVFLFFPFSSCSFSLPPLFLLLTVSFFRGIHRSEWRTKAEESKLRVKWRKKKVEMLVMVIGRTSHGKCQALINCGLSPFRTEEQEPLLLLTFTLFFKMLFLRKKKVPQRLFILQTFLLERWKSARRQNWNYCRWMTQVLESHMQKRN